ncbi:ent-kaurene oxidase [Seiridium cupressi]
MIAVMERLTTALADHGPVVAPLLIVLTSVFVIAKLLSSNYTNFPLLGKEFRGSVRRRKAFLTGAAQLYRKGYETFRDQPVRLTTADGDPIVVPNSALEELRRLPDDGINNRKTLDKTVERRFTGLNSNLLNQVVRADLIRSPSLELSAEAYWPVLIPELAKVSEHRQKARDFLVPMIKKRRAAIKNGVEMSDDMLQWVINKAGEFNVSGEDLADTPLTLSLAVIHTTIMTAIDIFCELITRPEVVDEVWVEIKRVLKENEGTTTIRALFDVKLLDGVMRESKRLAPLYPARFSRYVSKPITLSNGLHIPAGFVIESLHGPVTQDPTLYPNPERFDAHRFVDLRTHKVADPID